MNIPNPKNKTIEIIIAIIKNGSIPEPYAGGIPYSL